MNCPKCGEHVDFTLVPIGQMPTDDEMTIIRKMKRLAKRWSRMGDEP